MQTDNELESQLAHLYTVYSAQKVAKTNERVLLLLLKQFLELDPPLVWGRGFDDDLQTSPAVRRAVAAARRKVPKPAPTTPAAPRASRKQ